MYSFILDYICSRAQQEMGCVLSNYDISGEGYRIRIVKEIAKGGFGVVLQCEDIDSGDKYAVKKIVASSQEDINRIENEVKMHKMLVDAPQVVQLVAFIQNSNSTEYYIVFPFYSRGTIADLLEKKKGEKLYLDEDQILRYFESICLAVEKIHEKGYAHRDLKTANFLISEDGKAAHLTDFGSAAELPVEILNSKDHHKYLDETAEMCSMPYRAPELFSCDIGSVITEAIDIWSLGCCLYAFCFYLSPFESIYEKGGSIALASQSPHKIDYLVDGKKYNDEIIDLIKGMLQVDPGDRPKIGKVLENVRKIAREDRIVNT